MSAEFIEKIKEIVGLFDCGAEIQISEEAFTIVGYDYMREKDGTEAEHGAVDGVCEWQQANVQRRYEVDFDFHVDSAGDNGDWVDTLSPVIERIKKDTATMYGTDDKKG